MRDSARVAPAYAVADFIAASERCPKMLLHAASRTGEGTPWVPRIVEARRPSFRLASASINIGLRLAR